ncbi:metallo-beta-lactamase superfamily enzyme [Rhizobium sp. CF122]|nr:metallo-beta-lactamase superfamily enzyme [Rhizobium sp. CF122]
MERVAPDKWYEVKRLADDVTLISEPFIQEFYRCNIWHVRGRDRDMLVDSGMGVVSLREWVPLVTERDLIAVASHTHFDHIGCHHEFECRAVHSAEADHNRSRRPVLRGHPYARPLAGRYRSLGSADGNASFRRYTL